MKFNLKTKTFRFYKKIGLNSLIAKSSSVFFRKALGLILSFIWVFLITNLFGSEVYGLFSLGQVLIGFSGMIFGLGLDQALIKLGANKLHFDDDNIKSDFLKVGFSFIAFSSIICGLIFFFLRDFLAEKVFNNLVFRDYLLIISIFFSLFLFHKVSVGFLTVQKKFKLYGNYYFIFPNLAIIIGVLIIYLLKIPSYYLIGCFLLSYGVSGFIAFFHLPKISGIIEYQIKRKDLLKISLPMMISSSFLFITSWTDVFMLGIMVDKGDLGVYNVAYKLSSLTTLVLIAVNTVITPKISEYYYENRLKKLEKEVFKATKLITYITFPLVLILIVFRHFILSIFGAEFQSGGLVLIVISIGMLFNAISGPVGQILNMTGSERLFRNLTVLSALINVGLNVLLIQKYGILGAALASMFASLTLNLLGIYFVRRNVGFYSFFRFHI
ncbi:flippase [Mangrovimonas sp. AS39]|uniref:flippase n=1 Tax=Mangrovimonas futianensis TaxID=2895523 RepID=UPI001E2E4DA7|nr:flippase [Mangrovimonas futianensis]MCF1190321.1 flippase [Mangrovimonas futianensis]MCF1193926.1 flippase [Mangrovimonas futianensis]MCF1420923.1 flippase [Mangrovimonas futianensis]